MQLSRLSNSGPFLLLGLLFTFTPIGLSQASTVPQSGTSPVTAEIQAGLDAYQRGETEQAITHFEKANDIQPENPEILLMLGSAYSNDVVPTLLTPDNLRLADKAASTLNELLRLRPDDGYALRELEMVYFNTEQWDKAKLIQQRILGIEPSDFEAEYTIGVIDWMVAYRFAVDRLKSANITLGSSDYPNAPPALCRTIAVNNRPLLDDAVDHLRRAAKLHSGYRDALAYLPLVYRLRAGTDCADQTSRKADLASAAEYASKAAALPSDAASPASPQPPSALVPLPPLPMAPPPPPPAPPPPPSWHSPK